MLCLAVEMLIQHYRSFQFALKTCKLYVCRGQKLENNLKGTTGIHLLLPLVFFVLMPYTGERYDPEPKSKWDEDWDKKSTFPFSDKLGELSDKIGSTIDDTISKFRRKDREDSPERCRY